jgi:hypothetical protein
MADGLLFNRCNHRGSLSVQKLKLAALSVATRRSQAASVVPNPADDKIAIAV